jgi:hypothetical protein
MKPARASKAKERMTRATKTSSNVNPLGFNNGFKRNFPSVEFEYRSLQKLYQEVLQEKERNERLEIIQIF